MAQSIGLDDTVNDSLVVQDLAGGNSSSAAVLYSVHEGTQLLEEQVAAGIQGDLGAGLLASDGLVNLQRLVEVAVPALGGGDTQTTLSTQNQSIAGSIHVHSPGDT